MPTDAIEIDVLPIHLYLVQHGHAYSEHEDPARPLSEIGRYEVTAVARFAAERRLDLGAVHHSGKLRAQQTAEILVQHTESGARVVVQPGLEPHADPRATRALCEAAEGSLTLVGHLPHLSRLAGLLLTGDSEREPVAFHNGAIVALECRDAWRLRFVLTPELAGA